MRLARNKNIIKMPEGTYEIMSVSILMNRKNSHKRSLLQITTGKPEQLQGVFPLYYTITFRETYLEISIWPSPKKQTDLVIRYSVVKEM